MDKDVRSYVSKCEVCKAAKPGNKSQTAPMGRFVEPKRPWETLYIDFVGPLPRSTAGNTSILTAVDAFSKFAFAHPVRTATTASVNKFLEEKIFMVFGVPTDVISDNGSQFISNKFIEFLESYGAKFKPISRYHP